VVPHIRTVPEEFEKKLPAPMISLARVRVGVLLVVGQEAFEDPAPIAKVPLWTLIPLPFVLESPRT
jgi:hypothetical protein